MVDVSNAILGKPLPAVSTIDSSDLILEKGGLQKGWHGVLALGSEVSDIAPGDALTIDQCDKATVPLSHYRRYARDGTSRDVPSCSFFGALRYIPHLRR